MKAASLPRRRGSDVTPTPRRGATAIGIYISRKATLTIDFGSITRHGETRRKSRRSATHGPGNQSSGAAGPRHSGACATQLQPHAGAAAGPGTGGHLAVLGPRQLAHDVEPEADPPEPAPVAGLTLDEPLEDPLMIPGSDANALVLHADLDPVACQPGRHRDRAALR